MQTLRSFRDAARRCRGRSALAQAILLGVPLQAGQAGAQLPASPTALVAELGRALSTKDVAAYAALLADDFVFTPRIEVSPEPLDRAADIEMTRRLLSAAAVFQAQFRVGSETTLSDGVSLRLRSDFLATDSAGNGHRISGVVQDLIASSASSGWQIRALTDGPAPVGAPAGPISSWHALRLEYAGRSTAIADASWAQVKARQDAGQRQGAGR